MIDSAPTLQTDRLVLRAHRIDDFAACAKMWADPEVVRFISGSPSTHEQSWSRLLRYTGHWSLLGYGYWVVEAKSDGRFVGEIGFADYRRNITPSLCGRPEAGWVLRSEESGQGYATEAVARAHQWADDTLRCDETVCIVAPEHPVSIRVAQKIGYVEESMGNYLGNPTKIMVRPIARTVGSGK